MRHYRLTNQERAGSGFTDQFVIDGKELDAVATTQSITLLTLGATGNQAIVDDFAVIRVDEAIGGTAGATLKAELGHNVANGSGSADPNYWVGQKNVKTGVIAGTVYGPETTAAGDANRFATTLDANVAGSATTVIDCTITTAGSGAANFSTTTNTGQISIFMRIVKTNDMGYDQS